MDIHNALLKGKSVGKYYFSIGVMHPALRFSLEFLNLLCLVNTLLAYRGI